MFNCLEKDLDLLRHHFLEASAGTGKTFAIEHIICRLILEKNLDFRKILVVTFTRAATRELKARIHHRLSFLVNALKAKDASSLQGIDYALELLKDPKNAIRQGEGALAQFEELPIYTIHGFCYFLCKKYAFFANLDLALDDSCSLETFLEEKVIDFLHISSSSTNEKHLLIALLRSVKNDVSQLIKETIHALKEKKSASGLFNQLSALLDRFCYLDDKLFLEDFQSLCKLYKGLCTQKGEVHEKWLQQAATLIDLIKTKNGDRVFDLFVVSSSLFLENFSPINKKKSSDNPPLHYPDLFPLLHQELLPLLERISSKKELFAVFADKCQLWLDQFPQEEALFSPDDLLRKTHEMLSNSLLVEKIQKDFEVALIDEFQDTDPLQWQIFETLFLEKKILYLVGDPKQSIYGFRNADLYTYFAAKQKLESKVASLQVNYRSEKLLLQSLNHLFSEEVLPGWIRLPQLQRFETFTPVKPFKQENFLFLDGKGAVHFIVGTLEEKAFFSYLVKEIIFLKTRGISFSEIVILIKDRYQEKRLLKVLHHHKIPARGKTSELLIHSSLFKGFVDLLKALKEKRELTQFKLVLLSPLFNWSLEDLASQLMDEKGQKVLFLFQELSDTFINKGFPAFLNLILSFLSIQYHSEFILLCELLLEKKISSFDQALHCCEELEKKYKDKEQKLLIKKSERKDEVLLMTTYASKGLEFDIVFALGLSLRSHESVIKLCPEKEAEKMRLLYVAFTRAKKRLYVPFLLEKRPPLLGGASSLELFLAKLNQPLLSEEASYKRFEQLNESEILNQLNLTAEALHKNHPHSLSIERLEELPDLQNYEEEKTQKVGKQSVSLTFPFTMIKSFSSLAQKNPKEKIQEIPLFPTGAEIGTLFHHFLEKALKNKWDELRLKKEIERKLINSPFKEFETSFTEIIICALKKELLPHLRLWDLPASSLFEEMEFVSREKEGFMKGFIDLIFLWENKYYIVDWKSNFLGNDKENYSANALEKIMEEENYFLQANIYAEALKKFLNNEQAFGGVFYIFLRGLIYQGDYGIYRIGCHSCEKTSQV